MYYKSEETKKRALEGIEKGRQVSREKKIQRENEYLNSPTLCKQCGTPLSYKRKRMSFCNSSCSAIYNNPKRPSRKKIKKEKQKELKEKEKVDRKFCPKCKIEKSFSEFYIMKTGRLWTYCKECEKIIQKESAKNFKQECVDYKGGKCIICGYNKALSALDFHHLDPTKKDFGISTNGTKFMNEIVKKELDKCVLVCSNCHREIHEGLVKLEL